jgi:cysteinyl-tRNA synthetase
MSVFFDWIRKTNIEMDNNKLIAKKAAQGLNFIAYFDSIYGLLPKKESIPQNILDLVAEREEARRNGEWEKSDRLRNLIASEGWLVKDTPSGSKLSVK